MRKDDRAYFVATIRNGVRLRHRLAANEEIQHVETDPAAVNEIRLRHRFEGDAAIKTLIAATERRFSVTEPVGSLQWRPTFEEILEVCALSRRELWEATGEWERQLADWRKLDEEQAANGYASARGLPPHFHENKMEEFADYPGVTVELPELPASPEVAARVVTGSETDKVCGRGHAYSTEGAPAWLGGRCPTCRAASKLDHSRRKLAEAVAR